MADDEGLHITTRRAPARRAITLKDVAAESGVSITTVSRVLNGQQSGVPIGEETKTRVIQAAAQLGYKPNLMARALRGARSSLLGVIARDISDPFHIQILRGINSEASLHEYRLFLGHVDYRPEMAVAYASMFEQSHADGIIVIGDLEGGDAALDILASQLRFVVGVTDRTERRQVPGVYADSAIGTELAMEHLVELGHRNIMCVSDSRTYDGRLRIDSYERFMHARGLREHIQVHITDQEPDEAYELGTRILRQVQPESGPTAAYVTSDTTVIGLLRAAYELEIDVPGRLSLVGYDDIDIARHIVPPLTTVSQDGVEMGRAAARLLFTMMDKDLDLNEVADVVLTPRLVARRSTAQVPEALR